MKGGIVTTGLVLARNTILSRWMVVVAGFFIMSVSGAIYAFGVYSGALKTALGYNQKTLTTVGFFKDFGNIGIVAGLIADLFPAWVVLSIGVAFNTVGYLMIWMSVTKRLAKPALWQMYLFITIGGNSVAFTHAGALVTCVKDFPLHRGMIVGLLKGFLGLSTAILTLIYHAIYGDNPRAFILLITYLPLAVIFSFMFFIRPMPVPNPNGSARSEKKFFYKLLGFELLTAAYLMVVILVQHTVGVSHRTDVAFGILLLFIFFIPVAVVVSIEAGILKESRGGDVEMDESTDKNPNVAKNPNSEAKNPNAEEIPSSARVLPRQDDSSPEAAISGPPRSRIARFLTTPPLGDDFTVWQALVHPEFWLLSIASTAGFGAGLMLIDNLGQVGASFGYDTEQTSTFVSLISIWNCLGRVGVGFISEFFLQRSGISRPFFFAIALILSAAGYLAIALALPGALFIGSIIIGLCYGAQWSLLHIIVSEVFGLKYYGTLQSIIAMASPLGTYLLSVRVAGYLYDREGDRQRAQLIASGATKIVEGCKGTVCYRTSFFVMAAVCVFGCCLMVFMGIRTMRFYGHDVFEKLKAAKLAQKQLEQEEDDRKALDR